MHLARRSVPSTSLLLGAIAALAVEVRAQAPSAWADLALAGPVNPANVANLGKLALYDDGVEVHGWSAFTRRWTSMPSSGSATLRVTNDCALLRDAGTWTAFSSYGGRFAPIAVSGQAQLVNPTTRDNDSILLVLDGGVLHAFSGFTGAWTSRAVTPAAQVAVQRHVAVLADGNVLGGLDAYSGQWRDVVVAGPVQALTADGNAATAVTATTVYGFSGVRSSWSSAPALAGAPAFARNDDWAIWHDGATALAYSGLTGTFAAALLGPVSVAASEDGHAVLAAPAGHVAFSAFTGSFSAVLASNAASVRAAAGVAVFVDGTAVTGWSPVRGAAATITLDSGGDFAAGVVGLALGRADGMPRLYSALTNRWNAAPPAALPGLPVLTTTNALLPSASGVFAFSARTGAFVHLVGQGLVLEGNTNSAPSAAWDATHVHAFDARTDRWVSQPLAGTGPLSMQIWRTELVAIDGSTALGFGAAAGAWHSIALPEPQIGGRASSESATIVTNTHVFAFAPIPETSCLAQFPEFRRAVALGSPLRLQLRLPQGELAFFAGGPRAAAPLPVPGLGTLLLDPAAAASLLVAPDPGEDRATFALAIPNAPALHGTEWFFQSLVLPATAQPYLTEAGSVYLP